MLVEDETLALERLERLLKPFNDVIQIIDTAASGKEAVEKINKWNPDLIFLDIQIPDFNGFEVIKQIKNIPIIIFCTAFEEYALAAFDTNAIDYLLKPIDPGRLKQAVEKLQNLTINKRNEIIHQIQNLSD